MGRSAFMRFLGIAIQSALLCASAGAQDQAGTAQRDTAGIAGKPTKVALAKNSGPPGTSVVVPIYFTPAEGVQVGRVKLEVNFVSSSLKFEKLQPGVAAKAGKVEISSDVSTVKNAKGVATSTVIVNASAASADAAQGIPQGILAYLALKISEKARPGTINLRASVEATELGSGAPLKNVQAIGAPLEVAWVDAPPSVSCFFFSH